MLILDAILNIVFPVNCIVCEKNGANLCTKCLTVCPIAERECPKFIFPLFDYRHPPVKKAISLLKYKNKKTVAKTFGEVLYPKIMEELADLKIMENFNNPVLIPIPVSKKRMKERGFNQSELICKKIIKLDTQKIFSLCSDVLIKPNETEHQAQIHDRKKRLENIIGSFAIKNEKSIEKIKNRNIILIDDVITTGATLSEAKKILKQNGARKIIAFTVAH